MSICSKNELDDNTHNIQYTTDEETILDFLDTNDKKIICITYQSLETFVNCIEQTDIDVDLLIYDEAHHTVGNKIQQLVFNNPNAESLCGCGESFNLKES